MASRCRGGVIPDQNLGFVRPDDEDVTVPLGEFNRAVSSDGRHGYFVARKHSSHGSGYRIRNLVSALCSSHTLQVSRIVRGIPHWP